MLAALLNHCFPLCNTPAAEETLKEAVATKEETNGHAKNGEEKNGDHKNGEEKNGDSKNGDHKNGDSKKEDSNGHSEEKKEEEKKDEEKEVSSLPTHFYFVRRAGRWPW